MLEAVGPAPVDARVKVVFARYPFEAWVGRTGTVTRRQPYFGYGEYVHNEVLLDDGEKIITWPGDLEILQ